MAQIPKREAIIDALATLLGARRADREMAELPARVLWDAEDAQVERDRYGAITVTTTLSLIEQHYAAADYSTWSTQGNAMLAQAIADATGLDRTLGGLADDLTYTAAAIMYPDEGSSIITVGIDLAVRWMHPVGNPYIDAPDPAPED